MAKEFNLDENDYAGTKYPVPKISDAEIDAFLRENTPEMSEEDRDKINKVFSGTKLSKKD